MDISNAKINNAIDTLEKYIDSLDIDEDTKSDLHVLSYMVSCQYTSKGIANALSMISHELSEEEHYQQLCDKFEKELEKGSRKAFLTVIDGGNND